MHGARFSLMMGDASAEASANIASFEHLFREIALFWCFDLFPRAQGLISTFVRLMLRQISSSEGSNRRMRYGFSVRCSLV